MFALRPWKIGRIFGIPIGIDPSWLIIFVLLTYQLAFIIFPLEFGLGRRRGIQIEPIILAVIASLLLFASVLAHELSHAYMALKRGVPVLGITLFIFGGVAQIGDEPDTPATEFLIAIMGPLMSLVLALLAGGAYIWSQAFMRITPELRGLWLSVAIVSFYLAQTNLLLALFNMLPGFPLDGGRVFRALVWKFSNLKRATAIAMWAGRLIAVLLAALGAFIIIEGELQGFWMLLVGGFLWQAAGESYRSVVVRDTLKEVPVSGLMRAPLERVGGDLTIRDFVHGYLMHPRAGVFGVEEWGQVTGIVGADQVRGVARSHWDSTRLREIMVKLTEDLVVTPADTALRALQVMSRRELDELLVAERGQVIGSIGRDELARYLQWRGE